MVLQVAVRKIYSYVLYQKKKTKQKNLKQQEKKYIPRKENVQILSLLQFKQSSLLAGYTIKISGNKDNAMHWCFISILFRGLLYNVIIMQECHLEEIYISHTEAVNSRHLKESKLPPPLASVCLFLGNLLVYIANKHISTQDGYFVQGHIVL